MDKTVALWSLTSDTPGGLCPAPLAGDGPGGSGEPCSHPPTAQPVARILVPAGGTATASMDDAEEAAVLEGDGASLAGPPSAPSPPDTPHPAEGAPVFALAADLEHCSARAAALATMDGGPAAAARAARPTVFIGSASRSVAAWEPPDGAPLAGVSLSGHAGWVRALASGGRWLFSAGCGTLTQWDLSRPVPRSVATASLGDTGDVSALDVRCDAAGAGVVYAGGTDGSLRGWGVAAEQGGLTPLASAPRATASDPANPAASSPPHGGRVTAIVAPPSSRFIYTASSDGGLRAWDAVTLALAASIPAAHSGGGVRCATLGPDGLLYTGGDDGLVRRWRVDGGGAYAGGGGGGPGGVAVSEEDCTEGDPGAPVECWESVLAAAAGVPAPGGAGRGVVAAAAVAAADPAGPAADPASLPTSPLVPAAAGALYGHSHPVRALAAGPLDTLVSGDKGGDILVWRL